jgi:hypothetical protein
MICPAKVCLSEIDEDSIYCDQCGIELLICPKCGNLGEKKFCSKDGTKMISRKTTSSSATPGISPQAEPPKPSVTPVSEEPKTIRQASPPIDDDSTKTKVQPRIPNTLTLRHTSGKEIVLQNGDILGRKNGSHAGFLGSFAYISGTHAIVKQEGGKWFLIDQGSSNGTRVDGIDSEPNKQIELKSNGKLELADQEFIVIL